jgi:S1 RNA binding domain
MGSDDAWESVKRELPIGTHVKCQVKEHRPFGVFTTIAGAPFDGLIEIIYFKDVGKMSPSEYPPVGSDVEAVVLGFDESCKQIRLGVKPSQLYSQLYMRLDDAKRSASQKVIPMGIRFIDGKGFEFFGIQEVNANLWAGVTVVAVEEGQMFMRKMGENDDSVRLQFSGFTVNVILEEGS